MPNTDYLNIARPNVGDPFDKNDTNFIAGTHIDILDELDRRTAHWISSSALTSIANIANTATVDMNYSGADKSYVVGNDNKVYDIGNNYNILDPVTTSTLYSVRRGGGNIIVVGSSGYIAYYNFTSWTQISTGTTQTFYTVEYAPSASWTVNTYIAAGTGASGANAVVFKSTDDGATWTDISTTLALNNWDIYDSAFDSVSGTMVLVGRNKTDSTTRVVYSTDGNTWTTSGSIIASADESRVYWDGSYWWVSAGTSLAWSSDLVNWSSAVIDSSGNTVTATSISSVGNLIILPYWNWQFGFDQTTYIVDRYELVANSNVVTYDWPARFAAYTTIKSAYSYMGRYMRFQFSGSQDQFLTAEIL